MSSNTEEVQPAPKSRRIEPALLLGMFLLVLAVVALVSVRPWRRSQVRWGTDLSAAGAEARKSGHPVFVEVSADWCEPCHLMERDTFSDAEVGKALRRLSPVHLNDDRPEVQRQMERWHAFALPTHLLLSPNGTVLAKAYGYMGPEAFMKWLGNGAR